MLGAGFVLARRVDVLLAKGHRLRAVGVRGLGEGVLALVVARDVELRVVLVALRQGRVGSLFELNGAGGDRGGEGGCESEDG